MQVLDRVNLFIGNTRLSMEIQSGQPSHRRMTDRKCLSLSGAGEVELLDAIYI